MPEPLLPTITSPADLKALPADRLTDLAAEMRTAIIDQVASSGGHLAPNLGVVELTIALHRVFDFGPVSDTAGGDRLLFDVGHQCYPHKLLTGRLPLLDKLRQKGGMAGFPEPSESEHDLFSVGHAGTAISTAVGLARGDDMVAGGEGKSPRKCAVLIGDASIVNGVALEGLNNAGTLKRQFLTVLNDNGMSIAKPQGAMAGYFDKVRVSTRYNALKRTGKRVLDHVPGGSLVEEAYHRGGEMLKALIAHEHMFEHFGHLCLGPIDGHDLHWLIEALEEVKQLDHPVLLHVKTVKGKGFEHAEGDATAFHSPAAFKMNGCRVEIPKKGRSFTAAYADAMATLMKDDDKIVAVTAAMPDGTGVAKLIEQFPQRTLDTGICESHAMDMCAGMAKSGMKPFFAVYSTFSQRALDQVFQEVALQGLPVRVCMDRAGYVGGDGAVHHGFMDISMFRVLPGSVLLAASDEPTLKAALRFMADYGDGATFLRYPRDSVADPPMHTEADTPPFVLGKANLLAASEADTPDLAILAYGTTCVQARDALALLRERGHDPALYDARFAKPVDVDLLKELLGRGVPVLTVEDHFCEGGFGSAVLEAAAEANLDTRLIHRLGMPAAWVGPDSRAAQLRDAGLDPAGIARRARAILTSPSPDHADFSVPV
ncbi:MAG: 1-deoxy-D-xylulose-5-phosphate synthase [Planctomycetota bacterium]